MPEPQRKLKLKATHTHAGVAYPAGAIVAVDAHSARWLIDRGIAEPIAHATSVQPAPTDPADPVAISARPKHPKTPQE